MRIHVLDTIPGYAAAVAAAGTGWDVIRVGLEEASARRD